MHLYQHSPRCSIAMQMFLNCYPHYWIFVPMPSHTAQEQNMNYIPSESTTAYFLHLNPRISTRYSSSSSSSSFVTRNDREIRQCLSHIPLPPVGYQFSEQQRDAQVEFFKYKQDYQLPDLPLDLYNASIIAVLPDKTSAVLRQFIASLFITHGETKLNSIGNLLTEGNIDPPFLQGSFRGNWCHALISPLLLSSSTAAAVPKTGDPLSRIKFE
ncbi:unnamed protein product [Adineta steineri]|uniref:Uncharacterized protein n=1 Tax=Adineta steineri TaxID=433720 RepID=A0A816DYG2_9BILA|nr:unnamed protein product [Adineta steineri]CAF1640727.1 unnamed protein product [Adineta steineri]